MRLSNSFAGNPFLAAIYLQTFAFWQQGCRRRAARTPNIRLKFEVARELGKLSLCASVQAVPWADETEQQLCQVSLSGCELSADVFILGAGLPEAPVMDPEATLEV